MIERTLEAQVHAARRAFSAVVVTGPRRAGKTSLLRHALPTAPYYLFEDPDLIARFRADPQGFLDGVRTPAILDEVQQVPELFAFARARIDAAPKKKGQWFLTGSQESTLMQNVTESMAGRAAILNLLPLSSRESPRVTLLRGGFPEVILRPKTASLWFASYLQTYLERDVRNITAVQDLSKFRRFLALLAARHGAILNRSDIAAPLGVSVPTVSHWIDILETTGLIVVVPPYFENFGKRVVKSPKIYFVDAGLVCHLLGIQAEAELERSPFLGAVFEGHVASEILKAQIGRGARKELYYYRDQSGLEVDFLAPGLHQGMPGVTMIEAKAGRTPTPDMAAPMLRLRDMWRGSPLNAAYVVHRLPRAGSVSRALTPGAQAVGFADFVDLINW